MTKAELIRFMEPFSDEVEVVVRGEASQAEHPIVGAGYAWDRGDEAAHIYLVAEEPER